MNFEPLNNLVNKYNKTIATLKENKKPGWENLVNRYEGQLYDISKQRKKLELLEARIAQNANEYRGQKYCVVHPDHLALIEQYGIEVEIELVTLGGLSAFKSQVDESTKKTA